MSDSKRTGNRDISDLKARLGLKKGAGGTGQTQARGNGASGGVVPPPGLNLPPPPGVHQPAQPAIPNAHDDPFGAMNAMAAVGTVQRAPEIVINVNDGVPVENVGSSSMGATIAKIAIPAVLALGIGVGVGRVSKDANFYNAGLKDAGEILGDVNKPSTVKATKKLLSDLDNQLDAMSKSGYRPSAEATKQLSEMVNKLDVKSELVFRAKQNALDDALAGQILSFYSGVTEVRSMLELHLKSAKQDEKMLGTAKAKTDEATIKEADNLYLAGQARYAVVITAPTEQDRDDFGAKIVEIGPVFCGDKQSSGGRCESGAPSFGYRNDPGGIFSAKGDLVMQGEDSVPTKKLVPLLANGVRDALIKGAEPGASEAYYVKRLKVLAERTKKLITDANKLEGQLQSAASKGKRFSFFL